MPAAGKGAAEAPDSAANSAAMLMARDDFTSVMFVLHRPFKWELMLQLRPPFAVPEHKTTDALHSRNHQLADKLQTSARGS
jgi:hypothetical protein